MRFAKIQLYYWDVVIYIFSSTKKEINLFTFLKETNFEIYKGNCLPGM